MHSYPSDGGLEGAVSARDRPRPPLGQRAVGADTLVLAAICLLDLLTTLYWVSIGYAREGNPLMAWFLRQGHVPFIAAKLVFFVPGLIAAEWYRPRRPVLVSRLLRLVILAYVAAYLLGIAPTFHWLLLRIFPP